jgi:hypothetical protein
MNTPLTLSRSAGGYSNTTLIEWATDFQSLVKELSTPSIGQKDGSYFIRCAGTKRNNAETSDIANVLILDGDSEISTNDGSFIPGAPNPKLVHKVLTSLGVSHIIYSSHSNGATEAELKAKAIDSEEAYDADYHKYRVVIPCTYTPEQLPVLLDYLFNELHQAGVMLAPVTENRTWSQPWYFPRVPDEQRKAMFKCFQHDGSILDVETTTTDWLINHPKPVIHEPQPLVPKKPIDESNGRRNSLKEFNQSYKVQEILTRNGYLQRGNKYLRPDSESKMPGVQLCLNCKDGVERVFSHGGDVLNDGFAHDAFDCYRLLECSGDWSKALDWSKEISKNNQRLFMQDKAKQAKQQDKAKQSQEQSQQETAGEHAKQDNPVCTIEETAVNEEDHTHIPEIKPFPGAMTQIVESALLLANKPQPELTIMAVLVGMASCCNGYYSLPGGGRLNLYGMGIAGTGDGKEFPRNVAEYIADSGGGTVSGQPGSGAGLEDLLLNDYESLLLGIDELAHLMEVMNGSNKAPYLVDLSKNLLRLFSSSKTIFRTRPLAKTKGSQTARSLKNPCVNIIGFATPEKLGESVSLGNIGDGLLGRFLFCFGRDDVIPRRGQKQFYLSQDIADRSKAICGINKGVQVFIDSENDEMFNSLLLDFDKEKNVSTNPFAKNLKTRSFEKCERIAGVLAVWDQPANPVINLSHIEWARDFVIHSDMSAVKFCTEFMHGGEVQANASLIMKTIKRVKEGKLQASKSTEKVHIKNGRLPASVILRATKLGSKEFNYAMDHLIDLGDLFCNEEIVKAVSGREFKTRFLETH